MKQQKEIETEMVATIVANTNKITSFVVGTAIRAWITALSAILAEMWNDLVQVKRELYIKTAKGDKLDALGVERGVQRRSATKASAVVVFTGPQNTDIPAGTQIRSTSRGVVYQTKYAITIGSKNPLLNGQARSLGLGDAVIAESIQQGRAARVPARSLTQLVIPISNVSVNNPAPSIGGDEQEPDDLYANRMATQIVLLNQGTQAYYERLAQEAFPTVLRCKAVPDYRNHGVRLIVVKDSGAGFSPGELNGLRQYIEERHRAAMPITVENISFTGIAVQFKTDRSQTTIPLNELTVNVADALSDFLDFRRWEWGKTVEDDDLLSVCNAVPEVGNIDLSTFRLNGQFGDVRLSEISLPRLVALTIDDGTEQLAKTLTQSYANQT